MDSPLRSLALLILLLLLLLPLLLLLLLPLFILLLLLVLLLLLLLPATPPSFSASLSGKLPERYGAEWKEELRWTPCPPAGESKVLVFLVYPGLGETLPEKQKHEKTTRNQLTVRDNSR